ncbi:MAG: hypothetical protein Q9227_003803 [Pyrenula ochraceoflavens]
MPQRNPRSQDQGAGSQILSAGQGNNYIQARLLGEEIDGKPSWFCNIALSESKSGKLSTQSEKLSTLLNFGIEHDWISIGYVRRRNLSIEDNHKWVHCKFSGEKQMSLGTIELQFEIPSDEEPLHIEFFVAPVAFPSSYKAILGARTLLELGVLDEIPEPKEKSTVKRRHSI